MTISVRHSSYGRRAFAAGQTARNSLSDDLRDPTVSTDSNDVYLKLGCFQSTSAHSALEVSHFTRYYKSTTY